MSELEIPKGAGVNRHARRAQQAWLRKTPLSVIEKLALEQGKKRAETIDNKFQAIIKEHMPLRFKLLNRMKPHRLVKLFGLRLEVQGDFHTVKLYGKIIGSFTA